GINHEQLKHGQIIATPSSIKAAQKSVAQLYILTKDEGEFTHNLTVGIFYSSGPLHLDH
ncbi:hypothetical protein EDC04DRAFT_2570440, partial [Pisolithus marmoratus]